MTKKAGPHIRIDIRLSKSKAAFWCCLAVILMTPLEIGSETLMLSTIYPSPVGVYNHLITTGKNGSNSFINRDDGNALLAAYNPASMVGIGTDAPTQKLDVNGFARFRSLVQFGSDSTSSCSAATVGAMRWFTASGDPNNNTLQVCNGADWQMVMLQPLTPSGACSNPGQTQTTPYYQCSCGTPGSLIWQGTVTSTCAGTPPTWQSGAPNCGAPPVACP